MVGEQDAQDKGEDGGKSLRPLQSTTGPERMARRRKQQCIVIGCTNQSLQFATCDSCRNHVRNYRRQVIAERLKIEESYLVPPARRLQVTHPERQINPRDYDPAQVEAYSRRIEALLLAGGFQLAHAVLIEAERELNGGEVIIDWKNAAVAQLPLSQRTINALEDKLSVVFVSQLQALPLAVLKRVPNFGVKSIAEVAKAMRSVGLPMEWDAMLDDGNVWDMLKKYSGDDEEGDDGETYE